MFKVSRRLDYGVILMVALAKQGDEKPQPTSALAEALDIPLPFLHQIGHALMQAKLIKASPGPRGGIRLARPAGEISLLDIVETLEGSLTVIPCAVCQDDCDRKAVCYSRLAWDSLQNVVTDHLAKIHLTDLVMAKDVDTLLNLSNR
jgi:Rrf2 family protein